MMTMSLEDAWLWKLGYETGVKAMFGFLRYMASTDTETMKAHFEDWCNSDEYTTLDCTKADRYK